MNKVSSTLYEKDYFKDRHPGVDPKRERMYRIEHQKIKQFIAKGIVLDVGCGMGNFLDLFDENQWKKYGIEVSKFAADKAREKGVTIIDHNYKSSFFDLIVLRGVFQHLDQPLYILSECIRMLKIGGHMIFLATPNINAIMYRIFKELPMLEPKRNFVLPSDTMLKQILINLKMEVVRIDYPYWGTPYARPLLDHLCFLIRFLGVKKKFAFWKNMMEIYATKPFPVPKP